MKRFIVLCLVAALASTALAATLRTMSVQVREGQLRQKPSFLGRVIGKLNYADRVQVSEERGAWMKVTANGREGWTHTSALTRKRITLRAGDVDVQAAATSDEMVLAGKGFNAQVETEYKKKNRNLDFAWIDKMETFVVSETAMMNFLEQGRLIPSEGGAR